MAAVSLSSSPSGPAPGPSRVNSILAQGPVEDTSDAAGPGIRGHWAVHAPLEEQRGHPVALLELSDLGADGDDLARAVRERNHGELVGVRVSALRKLVNSMRMTNEFAV